MSQCRLKFVDLLQDLRNLDWTWLSWCIVLDLAELVLSAGPLAKLVSSVGPGQVGVKWLAEPPSLGHLQACRHGGHDYRRQHEWACCEQLSHTQAAGRQVECFVGLL